MLGWCGKWVWDFVGGTEVGVVLQRGLGFC
jgi:hypothetical protein